MSIVRAVVVVVALAGCRAGAPPPTVVTPPPAVDPGPGTIVAATPQRGGDPARGWDYLINGDYVGCGVPRSLYDRFVGDVPELWRLPGRTGPGAGLPRALNAYTDASGRAMVAPSCLACHSGKVGGQLIVGLGDAASEFTGDVSQLGAARLLITDPIERADWDRMFGRFATIAPLIRTTTIGANPADHIAAALFAHRDPVTLAWSDALTLPPPEPPTPVDVPAWWLLKKKAAMFHTGAGRGDQARIMMTSSVLCVDDVATATAIDARFPDVRAYLLSIEPPRFPEPIDGALAAQGAAVFADRCQRCHGSYGPDGVYQTRIISAAEVGTDPVVADRAGQFAAPYVAWFNRSFYGQLAQLVPGDGYVAPPLDGVWATAPYFHNGSVPSLAAVLDSSARPARFIVHRQPLDYQFDVVGWRASTPSADVPADAPWIYDTARPGHDRGGHTYGDALTAEQRRAVLEYLKSL